METNRSSGGASTAIVAIIAILAILIGVYFLFMRGGAPAGGGGSSTDINVDLRPSNPVEVVTPE